MNQIFAFFSVVFLFVNVAIAATSSTQNANATALQENGIRILGGTPSYQNFVVSIQQNDHLCTGVILSNKWTLTAASCVVGLSPFVTKIRYGSEKTSWGGKIAKIYKIIAHPQFNAVRALNDIALIETQLLDAGYYSSVTLTYTYQISGTSLNVCGWGTTFESNGQTSISQLSITVPGTWAGYASGCRDSYAAENITINSQTTLCVGDIDQGGKGICGGDAGTPALSGRTLYGVASFSNGCARTGFPGIFTAVGQYRAWIKQETGL